MDLLFIFTAPCIALLAPLLGPTVCDLLVLALAVAMSILVTMLVWQTWDMRGENQDEIVDGEAVKEDAIDIVHAAFKALGRNPGARSAAFRVVGGEVVHGGAGNGAEGWGDGCVGGGLEERAGEGSEGYGGIERGEREDGRDGSNGWSGREVGAGGWRGYGGFRRLGGFYGYSIRRREGEETIERMV